jgi:TPR repeat protein
MFLLALLAAACTCERTRPPANAPCASEPACAGACDAGSGAGCTEAARFALERPDPEGAARLWARACDLGDGRGCMRAAGDLTATEEVRARREALGRSLLPAPCERGDAEACELLVKAGRDDAERWRSLATAALRADCARGERGACHRLGSSLLTGRLGQTDLVTGAQLLDGACDAGLAGACAELGLAYRLGRPLPADLARATQLLSRAGELSAGLDAGTPTAN